MLDVAAQRLGRHQRQRRLRRGSCRTASSNEANWRRRRRAPTTSGYRVQVDRLVGRRTGDRFEQHQPCRTATDRDERPSAARRRPSSGRSRPAARGRDRPRHGERVVAESPPVDAVADRPSRAVRASPRGRGGRRRGCGSGRASGIGDRRVGVRAEPGGVRDQQRRQRSWRRRDRGRRPRPRRSTRPCSGSAAVNWRSCAAAHGATATDQTVEGDADQHRDADHGPQRPVAVEPQEVDAALVAVLEEEDRQQDHEHQQSRSASTAGPRSGTVLRRSGRRSCRTAARGSVGRRCLEVDADLVGHLGRDVVRRAIGDRAPSWRTTDSGVRSGSVYPGPSPTKISATRPPATEKIRPVGSQLSCERYVTSGDTKRASTLSPSGPSRSSVMRVLATGAITLALMLYLAPSTASTRLKPTRPIFADGVVGLAEAAEDAGARRRAHHAAVALLAHVRPGRRGDVVGAVEVDVDHRVPEVGRHVVERLVAEDAGVVDDDVDASEGVERGLHDRRSALGRRHRIGVGDSLAAECRDLVDHPLGGALVAAGAVDRSAEVVDDDRAPRATPSSGRARGRARHPSR